jgi:RNA polymerase sigma factor (sigma-70 family)
MSDTIDITQYASKLEELAVLLKSRHALVLSVEELCSAGYEELQRLAVSGQYNPELGEFWPYAYKHVVHRIIREVGLHHGLTRRQRAAESANRFARVTAQPVLEQSQRERHLQSRDSQNSQQTKRERFVQRWAAVHGTAVGYGPELENERRAHESMTPEEALLDAERKQLHDAALKRALAHLQHLPERQRDMFVQRYIEGTAHDAVAKNFGISKSRASHLLRKTREKLRLAVEQSLGVEVEP